MSVLRRSSLACAVVAAITVGMTSPAAADENFFQATLTGFEEVPALSSFATGEVRLKIDESTGQIEYTLSYENIFTGVQQAHIHFGQPAVNGGISVWLCGSVALPGPANTPRCPTNSGSVTGILTGASVIGPNSQFIAPGELGELIRALRAGVAYANVHSTVAPGGEIRGQLHE